MQSRSHRAAAAASEAVTSDKITCAVPAMSASPFDLYFLMDIIASSFELNFYGVDKRKL